MALDILKWTVSDLETWDEDTAKLAQFLRSHFPEEVAAKDFSDRKTVLETTMVLLRRLLLSET